MTTKTRNVQNFHAGNRAADAAVKVSKAKNVTPPQSGPVEMKIAQYLKAHGDSYTWDIAPAIGLSEKDTGKILRAMRDAGTITEVEPNCWELKGT